MKFTEIENYIVDNELLINNVLAHPGIYAIIIDDCIVYVGQSKNVYERCKGHIYNTQNAMFNQEKKYLLLLAAQLGGHRVDCVGIKYSEIKDLKELEDYYIEKFNPCLNILTPHGKNDISELKIEDVLSNLQWKHGLPFTVTNKGKIISVLGEDGEYHNV